MDSNNALSVSEINELIKTLISENLDKKIYIKGEISNVKRSNGNVYFSLKDENSMISIVFWKPKTTDFTNGDKVVVSGKMTCFSKQGTYHLVGQSIDKSGVGDLQKKYEKLKTALEAKSYFSKKREVPKSINRIGILTSLEGAALQDILYVLKTNNYVGEVYVKNCFVQGNNCPVSVKEGIEYFNNLHKKKQIDVLIIARGGGSIEDLMGYSSEEVVKALYCSDIITISAIGHEVDMMLSDLAADLRAPTPSIAGETIIKIQKKQVELVNMYYEKLKQLKYTIESKFTNCENRLLNLQSIHKSFNPQSIVDNEIYRLESLLKTVRDKVMYSFNNNSHELEKLKNKNNMYNKTKILKSGYVIITNRHGDLVDNVADFTKNLSDLKIMFHDGTISLSEFIKK
jgi:exodeoxyribonuclease VII large subunit